MPETQQDAGQSGAACGKCDAPVGEHDEFCASCGSLFTDSLRCSVHPSEQADGVCVICAKPYCAKCGEVTNRLFLCNVHWRYEIYEGMARVFGSTDNVAAQYVATELEQAGFHPFLYSRRFNPNAVRAGIAGMFYFGRSRTGEMKVLVPLSEALAAESTLKELGEVKRDEQ